MTFRFRETWSGQIRRSPYLQPCSLSYKRICQLLITNRGLGSVAGIDNCIIVQFEESLPDRANKDLEVSPRKIGWPDGLVEETISSQDLTVAGRADAAGRATGGVEKPNRLV